MLRWWRRWRERARGLRCCDCGVALAGPAGVRPSVSVVHDWGMEGDPRRRCRPCHDRYWAARVARRQEAFARLSSGADRPARHTTRASQARPNDAEREEQEEQEDDAERVRVWHLALIQARGLCVLWWWPRLDPCRPGRRLVAVVDVTTRGVWPGSGADTVARVREVFRWQRLRAPVTPQEARSLIASHGLTPQWHGKVTFHRIVLSLHADRGLDDMATARALTLVALEDLALLLDRRPVWVAGLHQDTDNTHAHILLAGSDTRGRSVEIRGRTLERWKGQVESRAQRIAG